MSTITLSSDVFRRPLPIMLVVVITLFLSATALFLYFGPRDDGVAFEWPEAADEATNVALLLEPVSQTVKIGQSPRLTLTLVNRGKKEVVLVEPGDGSRDGMRTPFVEWSLQPPPGKGDARFCGNTNALQPEEVFSLGPGKKHALTRGWIGRPYLPAPGRYRASVRYVNDPKAKWSGVPLGENDAEAMKKVQRSTPVTIVSNSVEFIVVW